MGVTAATNEAVDKARCEMNFAIFGALLVMCMVTFREPARHALHPDPARASSRCSARR